MHYTNEVNQTTLNEANELIKRASENFGIPTAQRYRIVKFWNAVEDFALEEIEKQDLEKKYPGITQEVKEQVESKIDAELVVPKKKAFLEEALNSIKNFFNGIFKSVSNFFGKLFSGSSNKSPCLINGNNNTYSNYSTITQAPQITSLKTMSNFEQKPVAGIPGTTPVTLNSPFTEYLARLKEQKSTYSTPQITKITL